MTGTHLLIDIKDVKRNIQGGRGYNMVWSLLNKLPDIIQMTKMDDPKVWEVKEGLGMDGVSGIVPIKESHISIHTFSDTGQVLADVFSCKPFNIKQVVDFFSLLYGGKLSFRLLDRGIVAMCNKEHFED